MIAASVVLAGLAAFCGVGSPRAAARLEPREPRRAGGGQRSRIVGGALALSVLCLGLGISARPVLGVGAWCACALAGTTAAVLVARRRRATAMAMAGQVARGCAIVAAECRLGRVATQALAVAAADVTVLAPAAGVVALGGDAAEVWQGQANRPGCHGLRQLARAWRVSARTGAPLADLITVVASDLRQQEALERVVDAELAAPRATSHLLAVLPLFGLVLGQFAGARPLLFLTSNRYGLACLVLGTVLTSAGVLWAEWLARSSGRQQS